MTTKASTATNTSTETVAKPDRGPKPPSDTDRAAGRAKAASAMAARKAAGLAARPDPIEKAQNDPTSLRKLIAAKCADCVCWRNGDPAPAWRIGNCLSTDCPLYPARPYQRLEGTPTPKALVLQFEYPVAEKAR